MPQRKSATPGSSTSEAPVRNRRADGRRLVERPPRAGSVRGILRVARDTPKALSIVPDGSVNAARSRVEFLAIPGFDVRLTASTSQPGDEGFERVWHGTVLGKTLTIKGYVLFELLRDPAAFSRAKQYVFNHLASGDFKPRIDKTFPLTKIVEAHRYMESNAQIGKIVVTV